jgi:hypothetical protein
MSETVTMKAAGTTLGKLVGTTARGRAVRAAAVAAVLVTGYFAAGAALRHHVDDHPAFVPAAATPNGSQAIDIAAALLTREVDVNGWQPNNPWFYPTALIDNGANFQSGIIFAVGRFALEYADHVGRSYGSAANDLDLRRAASLLQYPGTVWLFQLDGLPAPTTPSEDQYRAGRDALLAYNTRLAAGQAGMDVRAEALIAVLTQVARDVASLTATAQVHMARNHAVINAEADNLYYQAKGAMYAYSLLLPALGKDFEKVLRNHNLTALWDTCMATFRRAAALRPPMILDGSVDGPLFANHLAGQGFYTLLAQTQLNDLTRGLQR